MQKYRCRDYFPKRPQLNGKTKALVEKGWVKVDNFRNSQNKLAYAYILTPKGVSEKAKVTLSFLQRKRNEFEAIKKEIEQLQLEIQQSGKSTE